MQDAFSQFKTWYFSKPLITRSYLAVCVAMTLLITLGVINPKMLFYTPSLTFLELNIWRPFTALFFMGKFDFGFIFSLYFAFMALNKVQTQIFSRQRYHDFLWLCVVLFLCCILIGSIFTLFWFTDAFLMAMIYIWCKRLPHEQITFMFGLRVKTGYFPFVYSIAMTLFGASLIPFIFGIIMGHAYIFVKDIAVVRYHKDYLPTPVWFTNWWFGRQGGAGQVRRPQANNIFGGQGVRLD